VYAELRGSTLRGMGACLAVVPEDVPELVVKAFEFRRPGLQLKGVAPREYLVFMAEAKDLAEKWVHLISSGY